MDGNERSFHSFVEYLMEAVPLFFEPDCFIQLL